MNAFGLYKIINAAMGRRYNGSVDKFRNSNHYSFFEKVNSLLKKHFSGDKEIRDYIFYLAEEQGAAFSPYNIVDSAAFENFAQNTKKKSKDYYTIMNEEFDFIFNFCLRKGITDLDDYKNKWLKSHISSNEVGQNVAYVLGAHKKKYNKLEKKMLDKKFLKHIEVIEMRMDRKPKLKTFLDQKHKELKIKISKKVKHKKVILI